jgi:YbgC/YbaW family acyl-CoA thioester hydrolase
MRSRAGSRCRLWTTVHSLSEPVRVELADTDASGRIHHTAALRWAERAEHQLLRAVGWSDLARFPRRHVEVEFLAPVHFGDDVVVEIRATAIGNTSITYGWRVVRGDQTCITGSLSCVHIDADGRPVAVPDDLRRGLTAVGA